VIEIELPAPEFSEFTLNYEGGVRGTDDGKTTREPLKGRVTRNGPFLRKLTQAELAADPDNSGFVDLDHYEYYYIYVDIGFASGFPELEEVRVKLRLTSVPVLPEPTWLSMHPQADGDKVSITRTVRIGPRLKILDAVEAEVGGYEQVMAYQRTDLYVRAIPDGAAPQWKFTRTKSRKLDGMTRLALVVQAGIGATLEVSGNVTAQERGSIPWVFGRQLPEPIELSGVI
jgi:hypothetical protein